MSRQRMFSPGSPAAAGYRMPAEWETHTATWLAWPYNPITWETHLEGVEEVFLRFIEAIIPVEDVHLLVHGDEVGARVRSRLSERGVRVSGLQLHTIETGDVWLRDYGPLFIVREGSVAWTKWTYNAYGSKYDDLLIGNDVPDKMPIKDVPRFDGGMVLEGGSIDVNGFGSLLTTESCLLSPDRNPELRREEIERRLKDFFGITTILWLFAGIAGDDTTGHVDDVARFVGPSTVVTVIEEDPTDENFAPLQENLRRLRTMRNEKGTPIRVVQLPMPHPFSIEGRRMAASYANFYIANAAVIVPTYDQATDEVAMAILQEHFRDRPVRGIDCRELIFGYGSLHCITMQQPAEGNIPLQGVDAR